MTFREVTVKELTFAAMKAMNLAMEQSGNVDLSR
jgi:hypothetical protein